MEPNKNHTNKTPYYGLIIACFSYMDDKPIDNYIQTDDKLRIILNDYGIFLNLLI